MFFETESRSSRPLAGAPRVSGHGSLLRERRRCRKPGPLPLRSQPSLADAAGLTPPAGSPPRIPPAQLPRHSPGPSLLPRGPGRLPPTSPPQGPSAPGLPCPGRLLVAAGGLLAPLFRVSAGSCASPPSYRGLLLSPAFSELMPRPDGRDKGLLPNVTCPRSRQTHPLTVRLRRPGGQEWRARLRTPSRRSPVTWDREWRHSRKRPSGNASCGAGFRLGRALEPAPRGSHCVPTSVSSLSPPKSARPRGPRPRGPAPPAISPPLCRGAARCALFGVIRELGGDPEPHANLPASLLVPGAVTDAEA
ncbi:PREDICTED: nascent polypeptide-associated complex subunit alpha, muscle-specific form-like [Rhinopithecus bieti]|uniref:nascent polypeptide-associated complex subunit alpha, muscle-specific form-like n=1 Tax=Rhinopithecus bieti TaxID=61621 RepID=UPI00083C0E92|nr:PREDICTED: nascent polypeptide-associated complex subunit alpha, muscle-specific form-like [Rhinopithecus bieti]